MTSIDLTRAATARLNFLDAASQSLLPGCPTVSAHLQRTKISASNAGSSTVKHDVQRLSTLCSSCGLQLLPGWNCTQVRQPGSKRTRSETLVNEDKITQVRCDLCNEEVVIKQSRRRKTQLPVLLKGNTSLAPSTSTVKTYNDQAGAPVLQQTENQQTPSRKKGRGKNSSLQALLKKKQEQPQQSGFGLSFNDLLKS